MRRGWLAVAVFATAVVAGCGGAETTGSAPTPAPSPTPTQAAGTTPTPTPDGPSTPAPTTTEQPVVVPAALKFSGTTLDGKAYDGAKLAGKPTALWFWAPWCHICRGEAPTVKDLAAKHQSTVNVVGVAGLGEREAMREFVDDNDLAEVTQLADEKGAVWKRFDVTSQASWVLLDANGEEVFRGRLDHDELVDRVGELAKP
jgi:thiol-disulfide isomerase/thioredoxin